VIMYKISRSYNLVIENNRGNSYPDSEGRRLEDDGLLVDIMH
jgi:hypothetical protein